VAKILFLTHESLQKTAVARAMFESVAKSCATGGEHCISICSADESVQQYTADDIRYTTFKRSSYGVAGVAALYSFIASFRVIFRELRKHETIIVRSYPMMFYALWAKLWGNKIIFDSRGLFFEELFDSGKIKFIFLKKILFIFEKLFVSFSDRVISVSEAQEDYYGLSGSAKSAVIYNGAIQSENIKNVCLNSSVLNIGYVGSLISWHKPQLMFDILKSLDGLGVKYKFHLITPDPVFGRQLFSGLQGEVVAYAHDYRNFPLKFDIAFCLIADSLSKRICFPVKFCEYLASGTPVLFSENVNVLTGIAKRYDVGVATNLNEPPGNIANAIVKYVREHKRKVVSLPEELCFSVQVKNYKKVILD